jgi:ElaB/YqjD/DUF883 family membrane-anchored ribosome-binding protein
MAKDYNIELQDLKDELDNLKTYMADLGKTMSGYAQTTASHGRERFRDAADYSRVHARHAYETMEREVRAHPMGTVAVVALVIGAGLVLSRILNER